MHCPYMTHVVGVNISSRLRNFDVHTLSDHNDLLFDMSAMVFNHCNSESHQGVSQMIL